MKDVTLEWDGKEYVIPGEKAFDIGERIEDIVTLTEIHEWATRPKFFKMARCYGEMLRFAGARVSDKHVHSALMDQIKNEEGKAQAVSQAMAALIEILMDGAPEAAETKKKPSASSKRPSKSR